MKRVSDMWRYDDVAEYLGITKQSVRRKVMRKQLPHYKPSGPKGPTYFDPEEVQATIEKTYQPAR